PNCSAETKWYSRPSASPGRGARVVQDTDRARSGWSATRRRDSEVLPAPDGLEITSIRPRRRRSGSLDILHLLAELLDGRLQLQANRGEGRGGGLRAQGVGLTVELLRQEV